MRSGSSASVSQQKTVTRFRGSREARGGRAGRWNRDHCICRRGLGGGVAARHPITTVAPTGRREVRPPIPRVSTLGVSRSTTLVSYCWTAQLAEALDKGRALTERRAILPTRWIGVPAPRFAWISACQRIRCRSRQRGLELRAVAPAVSSTSTSCAAVRGAPVDAPPSSAGEARYRPADLGSLRQR